jgi:hypothetical protein
LLTIEGELDDISGCGQTAAAHGLCSGIPQKHQMHYEAKGAGHYGIFSGRRWREMVYPVVKSFILAHQAGVVAVTPEGQATKPARPARPRKQAQPAARVPTAAAKGKTAGKRSSRRPTRPDRPKAVPYGGYSPAMDELARRIDAALPQTQCTRCGYPDCAAYAEAIATARHRHQPLSARVAPKAWSAWQRSPTACAAPGPRLRNRGP